MKHQEREAPSVEASTASAVELVDELRQALTRAQETLAALSAQAALRAADSGSAGGEEPARVKQLEGRLEELEADREELTTRLVELEQQASRLMNLYVATYQLHATLDPAEVQATIAEIVVDLLGGECFVLLLRSEGAAECEVALSRGVEEEQDPLYGGRTYKGGDPLVDATLSDGVLRLGPGEGSNIVAAVPLSVEDALVGAIVLLKLFDHKPQLRPDDRDLLDLLAAHAASALFAARVYSVTDRRMRTLESLVNLARGNRA